MRGWGRGGLAGDIRNFTDCTEVLQGDVVKLVNGIAAYVHTAVKDNYGAPNKNIGDAFLVRASALSALGAPPLTFCCACPLGVAEV